MSAACPLSGLKPAQLQEITAAFQEFDENGNGSISPAEMKECLRKSKVPYEDGEVTEVIASMDSNNDGNVSFEEYLEFMAHVYRGTIKEYKPKKTTGAKTQATGTKPQAKK